MTDADFQVVFEAWQAVDLQGVKKLVDDEAKEIESSKSSSLDQRKQLSFKTKEFKKLDDERKLTQWRSLLKEYQNYIDDLTKGNNRVVQTFLELHKVVVNLKDPTSTLSKEQETNTELEKAVKKLSTELRQSEQHWASEKKGLEEKFNVQIKETEEKSLHQIKTAQTEIVQLKDELDQKSSENEELQVVIETLDAKLKKNSQGQNNDDTYSNYDMLNRDLESNKLKILELERLNNSLKEELAMKDDKAYQKRVTELEKESVEYLSKLEEERLNKRNAIKSLKDELDQTKETLNEKIEECARLNSSLKEKNDYEQIKQDLKVLKLIELGEGEEEELTGTLDNILLNKNKKLSNELVSYRSKQEDMVNSIQELEEKLAFSQKQVEQLQHLNQDLEKETSVEKWDAISMISANPDTSIQDNSLITMVSQQRDRFKQRSKDLEKDVRLQLNKISELQRKVQSLSSDNNQLYERIRFLSSYDSNKNQSKESQSEEYYKRSYEDKLHPIEQFRLAESKRISSRISPMERIFISLIRAILSTKLSRYLFLAYCISLHLIVMSMTMYVMNIHNDLSPEITINEGASVGGANAGGIHGGLGNV
ncbi:hypothetical protein LJB42_002097 [Komagataella kurtzmanii]|nr:hypothetical protein LJB42_002097 [Komagataella kurtzmanii]